MSLADSDVAAPAVSCVLGVGVSSGLPGSCAVSMSSSLSACSISKLFAWISGSSGLDVSTLVDSAVSETEGVMKGVGVDFDLLGSVFGISE